MLSATHDFWKGKKVLVTGHTGFKGTWLCEMLIMLGADVYGYALAPQTEPSMFDIVNLKSRMTSYIGDIRDFDNLISVSQKIMPDIVFHLAAQPIVRQSYVDPRYTYETNVMGTVNMLEIIRQIPNIKSAVNITTDKVYQNNEWCWGYRETDRLGGFDPYSNSKSCSELVTQSYISSFFSESDTAVSTVRAGNVIGGGDFAKDRILPDCVRASSENKKIIIRNPYSVRPYQHVLDALNAYLIIAKEQYINSEYSGNYNIGPDTSSCISTSELADKFCEEWNGAGWENVSEAKAPHEALFLKLDCSKMKQKFGWKPVWDISASIKKTVEWYRQFYSGSDMKTVTQIQVKEFSDEFIRCICI